MLFAVRVLTIVMIERQTLFYIVHAVFLKKVWGRQKFSFSTPGKLSDANTYVVWTKPDFPVNIALV